MRYRVTFSPESQKDLARMYRKIARNGFPGNAASFVASVTDFCLALENFPKRGMSREDLSARLRVLGYRDQALIAFKVDDTLKLVVILRIFGRGQSLEKAFA